MDKYRKSAEEIMRRGDEIIAAKNRRSAVYTRTAFAVSGLCAAIIAGVGIWNNPQLQNLTDRTPPTGQYIADTTETTVYSENKANTTTLQEEKNTVTSAVTAAKVTSQNTTAAADRQTEKAAETKTSPVTEEISEIHTEAPTAAVTEAITTAVTEGIQPQTTIQSTMAEFPEDATTDKPDSTSIQQSENTTEPAPIETSVVQTTYSPPPSTTNPPLPPSSAVLPEITITNPNSTRPPSSKPMTESPGKSTQSEPTTGATSPGLPTTAVIAPVEIEISPDNPDEVTGIIYDTILYKKTNDTAISDNIQYAEQKFLGIVCSDNKQYGELFVVSDFIDNSYDVLLFKPAGSNEYICFTP